MCTSGRMNLTRGGSHQDRSKIGLHDIDEGVSDLKARMDYCEDPARICRSRHQTTNFPNSEYFVCLLFY